MSNFKVGDTVHLKETGNFDRKPASKAFKAAGMQGVVESGGAFGLPYVFRIRTPDGAAYGYFCDFELTQVEDQSP